MSLAAQAAVLVSLPVAFGAAGAAVASVKRPGPRVVSGLQHFAAGVVLAAVAGELLPDLRTEGHLGWAVAGFTVGVALVLSLAAYGRRLDDRRQAPGHSAVGIQEDSAGDAPATSSVGVPVGFLASVAIDLLIDGLLIGLGVRLGSTQGLILTIALTLEILFLNLSLAAELSERGLPVRRVLIICTGLALCTAVGAIGAAVALGGVGPATLAFMLAFGAAALLYLAVEELLVEAHEQSETTVLSAMFFAGFLVIYVLGELG